MTELKVVIALCYRGAHDFLVIPECPYCFCTHKHRIYKSETLSLSKQFKNGAVVPFVESMVTKISDCLTVARTYALELREEKQIPREAKVRCRGITVKGTGCRRFARKGCALCLSHHDQLEAVVARRLAELELT